MTREMRHNACVQTKMCGITLVRDNTTIDTTFLFVPTFISVTSYMDNPGYENKLSM